MLSALLRALIQVVDLFLTVYIWLIIARAIASWVNPHPYHPVYSFLYRATEPVLGRVRRVIPTIYGLDLSPVIMILLIYLLKEILYNLRAQLFFYPW